MNPVIGHSSLVTRQLSNELQTDGRLRPTNDQGQMTNDVFSNEPLADFSREANRQAMREALGEVKKQLGKTYPMSIGGQEVTTPETLDWMNPSHVRELVGRCSKATSAQA